MDDEPFFYTAGVDVPEDVTHLVIGGVTVVEAGTFRGHRELVRVEIREGVREIGRKAFFGCRRLRRVDAPSSLRAIGEGAFQACSSLSEMNLPEGLRRIGRKAFLGHCFERIAVPSSVVEVGNMAYGMGHNLNEVTLAGGMAMMGRNAFRYCPELRSIATPSEVVVVEDGGYGSGRAEAAAGGTIARDPDAPDPARLILASPFLAWMHPEDVGGLRDAINRGIDDRRSGEGPFFDLRRPNDWGREGHQGADRIRSRFLGLLTAHRRAIYSILERALEPGVAGIISSFLPDVEGG